MQRGQRQHGQCSIFVRQLAGIRSLEVLDSVHSRRYFMNFQDINRRTFLARSGLNGALLLYQRYLHEMLCHHRLLQQQTSLGAINPLHHKPRAKSVIFLCLAEVRVISKRLTTNQFWLNKMVN